MHFKGYKIRIYPNKEQEQQIWKHIGACRFIWNYMINVQLEKHKNNEARLSRNKMVNLSTNLRKETGYEWMKDISINTLHLVCLDLNNAYMNFFEGKTPYPKFKTKKNEKNIFPTRTDVFRFEKGKVFIEKVGWIKYKTDFVLPQGRYHKFYNANVCYINGKYMVSFCMECENQVFDDAKGRMGIDLGIKKTAVVAFEDIKLEFDNINNSRKVRKLENRKRYLHKKLSHKCKISIRQNGEYVRTKNIEKVIIELRKTYKKLHDIRTNYNHQISHQLISMHPETIVIESLNIPRLLKNKHMSKKLLDQQLGTLIEMFNYKCKWNGINLVKADEYYPSSKLCSGCGAKKKFISLSERTYVCHSCGLIIDRDYNAALNLMRYEA